MNLESLWNNQINEKNILKVIEWSHRQKIRVESLSQEDIIFATKAYLRSSSHC